MPIEVHFAHRKAVFRPGDFITGHVLVISQDMSGCEGKRLRQLLRNCSVKRLTRNRQQTDDHFLVILRLIMVR